ncbi:MAG TPA: glutamate mutase L [Candidatus Ozemobacteraceae bacterium]|nr:glutamate mutase L [Candidatus Ozemobacteraceae bacterium]
MSKQLDFLTLEVGSTITKANGFIKSPDHALMHVAQGFAPTSVLQGNVGIGLLAAIENLEESSGFNTDAAEVFANSSAAGGLRVTVHGLTYNMTARAAKEASLGAGAIIKMVTAGELSEFDLEEIEEINPNMVILAGGVDFGAKEIVLSNAIKLASLDLGVPVVYAGNAALKRAVENIFHKSGTELMIAPNVFPDVDVLNVDPLRKRMQELFSKHIIHAPGMERLESLTDRQIIPTPGAVLKGAELFAEVAGDVLVLDVGGATTDVHSVTEGSREFADKLVDPEPHAKRTVEGDLGVYVNAANIIEMAEEEERKKHAEAIKAMPATDSEREMTRWLCRKAVETGVRRHAGVISDLYTPSGKKQIVKGKDLSAVNWVVGTGGALTRVEGGEEILRSVCTGPGKYLLPKPSARILLDANYLFSALGTICHDYPDLVRNTFKKWIEKND